MPTDYQFTGQRHNSSVDLYFYNARYYDPALGRFIQADSIVPSPGNPQSLNRYAYTLNNPLRYTDPTGHYSEEEIMQAFGVSTWDEVLAFFNDGGALAGLWGWLEILRKAQDGDAVTYGKALFDKAGIGPRTNGRYGYPYNGGWFKRNGSGQIKVYSGIDKAELTHTEFAQSHQEYWLYRPISTMPGNFTYVFSTYASTKHYHASFDASKVDWVDLTFDVAGFTADCFTVGFGGRAVNVIQAAEKTGSLVDALSIAYSLYSNFDGVLDGESAWGALGDVSLSYAGIGIQFWPDVISIVLNIGGAVTITN